ncbi:MAG: hypothetical protein COB78_10015 [Hyphomicrobiales bacterium]|nr:MAG: hypothetical protein COB78_10015 [Hyphomicrobiales bacterium]
MGFPKLNKPITDEAFENVLSKFQNAGNIKDLSVTTFCEVVLRIQADSQTIAELEGKLENAKKRSNDDDESIKDLNTEIERLEEVIKHDACRCMCWSGMDDACWSGMDDAPDDGTEILVHYDLPDLKPDWPRVVIVFWSKSLRCWVHQGRASYGYSDCYQPEAWMPKPVFRALQPPKEG